MMCFEMMWAQSGLGASKQARVRTAVRTREALKTNQAGPGLTKAIVLMWRTKVGSFG